MNDIMRFETIDKTAYNALYGNCIDGQDFFNRFSKHCKDRTDELKKQIREAGGYRGIWRIADRIYSSGNTVTTAIVEKWFHDHIDTPELAALDGPGYRYTISARWSDKYGFSYPSDFLAVYTWYVSLIPAVIE